MAGLWVAIAGVITGIVAAFVSAPIAAIVFGGVTGSGTDLIVAALRQGGSDVLQASLGQGLFSDPIDKLITSFVVFIILSNLSSRYLARFPLGDRLVRHEPATVTSTPAPTAIPAVDSEDQ
jgi:energy-coupling factor transport system substrate-specific component